MVNKTILEKLDSTCAQVSLKTSVCHQVQRIISTRMYLGRKPIADTWVTGFGVPEIVSEYQDSGNQHTDYKAILRQRLLALEPRLVDVHIQRIHSNVDRGRCDVLMVLKEEEIKETFFF